MPERRRGGSDGPPGGVRDADADLARLRELLVGPEKVQLDQLQERLDEDRLLGEDVARVLPEAVRRRDRRDEDLARALRPVVEKAVHASVRRDPEPFAEAIFPVIGPAIKRAIAEGLKSMVARLENVLEQTLSFRRQIFWRVEAARSGRPLAEVALSHSLRFRVEQAFLIHAETGLLLAHAAVPDVLSRGQDVVAGMLTAIRDFVRDSFEAEGAGPGGELETVEVGELTVFIERGRQSVLAAVVRGVPDPDLRGMIREVLGDIEISHESDLDEFDGDPAALEPAREELERCLVTQLHEAAGPGRGRLALIGLAIAVVIAALLGTTWMVNRLLDARARDRAAEAARQQAVAALDREPGYVVTEARPGHVAGLRDTLAAPLEEALGRAGFDPAFVEAHFETWMSTDPELALPRATRILAPPASVRLRLDGGLLSGEGSASAPWLRNARLLAPALPGVERVQLNGIENLDEQRFASARRDLEGLSIVFARPGSASVEADHEPTLRAIAAQLSELAKAGRNLQLPFLIEIQGHADSSGSLERNLLLSRRRAEGVLQALAERGSPRHLLRAAAQPTLAPVTVTGGSEDPAASRRATFRVLASEE